MKPRERILHAIRSEQVDRIPWVPFVGCHGASLIGVSSKRVPSIGRSSCERC